MDVDAGSSATTNGRDEMYGNDMVLTKEQIAAALAALERDVEYFTSCGTNPQSTRMMIAARRDLLMENAGEHRGLVWAHMEHAAKPTAES